MSAKRVIVASVTAGLLAAGVTTGPPSSVTATTLPGRFTPATSRGTFVAEKTGRHIAFIRWGTRSFGRGTFKHSVNRHGLVIASHPDHVSYRDPYGSSGRLAYDRGRWYSPWAGQHFALTELVASYRATTPVGTFIDVSARGRTPSGRLSSWDSLGRWASSDHHFHRMSLGRQSDDLSRVAVDTLVTKPSYAYSSWQLRVTLMRRAGISTTPIVRRVGAVVSRLPRTAPPTSQPLGRDRRDLDVPRFSQQIHAGEYPRWNGGGEAWCSPTSTSMVVAYWHRGPTRQQYAWVKRSYRQPWVDYAARYTFASGYDGTGDWPFNTAYAGGFGLDSFVTRLRSLRQAELFIKAGIPLAASISFGPGGLDGAPIDSTAGHVVVIRGFTSTGKVVVNDPAARSAKGVRRVYRRDQFERAWVGSTGGVVYVIHPATMPLPPSGPGRAW